MITQYILKLNLPLAKEPFLIKVKDPNQTLSQILGDYIQELEQNGENIVAFQLRTLLKSHTLMQNGAELNMGKSFQDLQSENLEVCI